MTELGSHKLIVKNLLIHGVIISKVFFLLFFFLQFWDVAKLVISHKKDLAIFGYRPAMILETFMNDFHVLATC
jgi:hypothetical protein